MPEYRRVHLKGGIYFITIVTYNRQPLFRNNTARQILHDAWEDVAKRFPFSTVAVCLLPEHIHTLIQCPETDSDYPMRIREIKRLFTAGYKQRFGLPEVGTSSRASKNEAAVWQRRYWEHTIRDKNDLDRHMDYIHYNPVKHGLVQNVRDWEWSSFHRYVRMGWYDGNWGSNVDVRGLRGDFGE
ncbi:MAG: transposase [Anaerolineaceae bacterium]|nr:transposase [Anaerolineaceae bacterium]